MQLLAECAAPRARQTPMRVEAFNLCANFGQHVMGSPGAITGGSPGESFSERIARDPASTGASTPEDYNKHMSQKQSQTFLLRNVRDSGFRQFY